jgi:hypothetical protein
MIRKRRDTEAPVVVRAAFVAVGMVFLQLAVASAMILGHLPPVLRSLHEATGVGIWLSCFVFAYLARLAARVPERGAESAPVIESTPAMSGDAAPTTAMVSSDEKPPVHTMAVIVARGADIL